MKKYVQDFDVRSVEALSTRHVLLRLTPRGDMPEMRPGQFVEVSGGPSVLLRRPISINNVDYERGELWLLVAAVGEGTKYICGMKAGESLNIVLPLGNGFTMPAAPAQPLDFVEISPARQNEQGRLPSLTRNLLVGGGVGVAPLLFMGSVLARAGIRPTFLLGARTESELLELDYFTAIGDVYTTTVDGSHGERGFVTDHSILSTSPSSIHVCGPKPMMVAMARYAKGRGIPSEVSLENMMACGVGACLCCVEKTVRGNVCVCTEGPVFNIDELTWQI